MTRVGVTGHQRLDDAASWPWVESALRQQLVEMVHPLVGVTSLAVGADQLFARLVLEQKGRIHAVLPFADIERSFSPADIPGYRKLLSQSIVEVLDTPGTDEDAYFAAGQRVVELSEILLAVWDGKPSKGKGGTADVVAHAISLGLPLIQINPVSQTILRSVKP